jgi:acyl carrier protein
MTRDQAYVLLNDIVRDVLADERFEVCDSTAAEQVAPWDSPDGIAVLAAAEVRFGIRIRADEALRIERIGQLIDLILDQSPRVVN